MLIYFDEIFRIYITDINLRYIFFLFIKNTEKKFEKMTFTIFFFAISISNNFLNFFLHFFKWKKLI